MAQGCCGLRPALASPLLVLLVALQFGWVVGYRHPAAAHSNFVRSNYFARSRASAVVARWRGDVICAGNASVCNDVSRYPVGQGNATCCFDRVCKTTASDSSNCGSCGVSCAYGMSCCSGDCIDIMSSAQHCGACGARCSRGLACEMGMCGYGSGGDQEEEEKEQDKRGHYPKQW